MSALRPGPWCFVARGVDLKSVATTNIIPALARKTSQLFHVRACWMVIQTLTGTLSVGCTFNIGGSNKGSTGSVQAVTVVNSTTLSTSSVKQSRVIMSTADPTLIVDIGSASGALQFNVTTGATVTTMTGDIWCEGVFV